MQTLFLLDAYALIFRAYYAFYKSPRTNAKGENTSAIFGFVNTLEDVLNKMSPTHIAVVFDPPGGTFRHDVYKEYKAQRDNTPESITFAVPYIKHILAAYNIPAIEVKGYEADDVIGTLAIQAAKQGIDTYMMTSDKDYAQLVRPNISIYKPGNRGEGATILGIEQVKEKYQLSEPTQMIDLLALMGDTADNIPGCPGIGVKSAYTLLEDYGSVKGIIAAKEKLPKKFQQKIMNNVKAIEFSYFLATIKTDVPITLDTEALSRKEIDKEALIRIYEELEFKNFINKLSPTITTPTKKVKQPSLFDNLFAENTDTTSGDETSKSLNSIQNVPHDYKLIDSQDKRISLCDYLMTFAEVALDTETTSTAATQAELVGLSFATRKGEAFYVAIRPEEVKKALSDFKPLFESTTISKIGQNIKYDLIVLMRYDIVLRGKLFDTMLAHYVLQPELRHNMDYLAETYLQYRTIPITDLLGPKGKMQRNMRDLQPSQICDYACEDADITLQLKEYLAPLLEQHGASHVFEHIEMPLVTVLAKMEFAGVRLDTQALAETGKGFQQRLEAIEAEIYKDNNDEPFNISSPKQVGEVLFDKLQIISKPKKTKGGQYVTSEEVLESLRDTHPIIGKILAYRGLRKLLSTYVDALPKLIDTRTGHIHTTFNQSVTVTGRLSSSEPNLQNIPIRGDDGREIRRAFVPEEGCLFFSADYSQIELRIMAHLSQDPHMIHAFEHHLDIHADTASKVYHKALAEVTSDERRKAKTANFGIIYGITTFGLASRIGISRKEAKELIDQYFEQYPTIHAYMQQSIAMAQEKGYTETLFGRQRQLPDIYSQNRVVREYAERNAINAPIQGTAADIIKIAMIRIDKAFAEAKLQSKMILQVHDELNFSVLPEEKQIVEDIVRQAMEGAANLRVPLEVACGWGENWLEAH